MKYGFRTILVEFGKIVLLVVVEELVRNLYPQGVRIAWMASLIYLTYEIAHAEKVRKVP
jgi:hypothetical protein